MTAADEVRIDPHTVCSSCSKAWLAHWGFNCDRPYKGRKFTPLMPGVYPLNRADHHDPGDEG